MDPDKEKQPADQGGIEKPATKSPAEAPVAPVLPRETGGPKGREPTRYQDWERGGRCIDF